MSRRTARKAARRRTAGRPRPVVLSPAVGVSGSAEADRRDGAQDDLWDALSDELMAGRGAASEGVQSLLRMFVAFMRSDVQPIRQEGLEWLKLSLQQHATSAGVSNLASSSSTQSNSLLSHALKLEELKPKKAIKLYERAMESGSGMAGMQLGGICLRGPVRDENKALKCYLHAANHGNPVAQHKVGYLHEMGIGTAPDVIEATRWYTVAASNGSADSWNNLGVLANDAPTAVECFRRAAALGSAAGKDNLSRNLYLGDGCEKNETMGQALAWEAVAQDVSGHATGGIAAMILGTLYAARACDGRKTAAERHRLITLSEGLLARAASQGCGGAAAFHDRVSQQASHLHRQLGYDTQRTEVRLSSVAEFEAARHRNLRQLISLCRCHARRVHAHMPIAGRAGSTTKSRVNSASVGEPVVCDDNKVAVSIGSKADDKDDDGAEVDHVENTPDMKNVDVEAEDGHVGEEGEEEEGEEPWWMGGRFPSLEKSDQAMRGGEATQWWSTSWLPFSEDRHDHPDHTSPDHQHPYFDYHLDTHYHQAASLQARVAELEKEKEKLDHMINSVMPQHDGPEHPIHQDTTQSQPPPPPSPSDTAPPATHSSSSPSPHFGVKDSGFANLAETTGPPKPENECVEVEHTLKHPDGDAEEVRVKRATDTVHPNPDLPSHSIFTGAPPSAAAITRANGNGNEGFVDFSGAAMPSRSSKPSKPRSVRAKSSSSKHRKIKHTNNKHKPSAPKPASKEHLAADAAPRDTPNGVTEEIDRLYISMMEKNKEMAALESEVNATTQQDRPAPDPGPIPNGYGGMREQSFCHEEYHDRPDDCCVIDDCAPLPADASHPAEPRGSKYDASPEQIREDLLARGLIDFDVWDEMEILLQCPSDPASLTNLTHSDPSRSSVPAPLPTLSNALNPAAASLHGRAAHDDTEVEVKGDAVGAVVQKAADLTRRHEYENAVKCYQQAIEGAPNKAAHADIYAGLSASQLQLANHCHRPGTRAHYELVRQAEKNAQRCVCVQPREDLGYFRWCEALAANGRNSHVEAVYEEAGEHCPKGLLDDWDDGVMKRCALEEELMSKLTAEACETVDRLEGLGPALMEGPALASLSDKVVKAVTSPDRTSVLLVDVLSIIDALLPVAVEKGEMEGWSSAGGLRRTMAALMLLACALVKAGGYASAQSLLPSPGGPEGRHYTGLHLSVRLGSLDALRFYLAQGTDPSLMDSHGLTALMMAQHGFVDGSGRRVGGRMQGVQSSFRVDDGPGSSNEQLAKELMAARPCLPGRARLYPHAVCHRCRGLLQEPGANVVSGTATGQNTIKALASPPQTSTSRTPASRTSSQSTSHSESPPPSTSTKPSELTPPSVVKECGACGQMRYQQDFSSKQWKGKGGKRRCLDCVAKNLPFRDDPSTTNASPGGHDSSCASSVNTSPHRPSHLPFDHSDPTACSAPTGCLANSPCPSNPGPAHRPRAFLANSWLPVCTCSAKDQKRRAPVAGIWQYDDTSVRPPFLLTHHLYMFQAEITANAVLLFNLHDGRGLAAMPTERVNGDSRSDTGREGLGGVFVQYLQGLALSGETISSRLGVAPDAHATAKLWRTAVEGGLVYAAVGLGDLCARGQGGMSQSFPAALLWWKIAWDMCQIPEAAFKIASCYWDGISAHPHPRCITPDVHQALLWFQRCLSCEGDVKEGLRRGMVYNHGSSASQQGDGAVASSRDEHQTEVYVDILMEMGPSGKTQVSFIESCHRLLPQVQAHARAVGPHERAERTETLLCTVDAMLDANVGLPEKFVRLCHVLREKSRG